METAFQQTKGVAIDAFKVKKQSSRRLWKRGTSGSTERQWKPSRKQHYTNCGYKKHTTSNRECLSKGVTCGYCNKMNWESVYISKRLDQKKKKETDTFNRQSISPKYYRKKKQNSNLLEAICEHCSSSPFAAMFR